MPNRSKDEAGELLSRLSEDQRIALELLSKKVPVREIRKRLGLSAKIFDGLITEARIKLNANDDLVSDFLDIVEAWQTPSGRGLLEDMLNGQAVDHPKLTDKHAVVQQIERDMSPDQMRDLSASLLRLADCIDQNWRAEEVGSSFRWPSKAWRVERDAINLAKKAMTLLRLSRSRADLLPSDLIGEPGWEMLLELFIQFAGGAKVSTTSLAVATNTPVATAIRHITKLEEHGLVARSDAQTDKRVTFVQLTRRGVVNVGTLIDRLAREA